MTSKQAKHAYEEWVKRGITFANHVCTVSSLLYRYAIDMEYALVNPFANIKRKTAPQRKLVRSAAHMPPILATALGQFKCRSLGRQLHS